jgi:ubiquinone biosynthesis accessory factor UbiJ
MILPQSLTSALEAAFNHYLSLDDATLPQLAAFEGKIIGIEVLSLQQTLFLFPSADGIMILSDYDGAADTTISGTPMALAKLGITDDAGSVLFSGEVRITGDTRLGHQFKKVLQSMHIDWEQHLSRYIGDIAAHQLSQLSRELRQWMQRNASSFSMDVGEYLQEESQLVVGKAELDRFARNVDELRSTVDRIEARLTRIP